MNITKKEKRKETDTDIDNKVVVTCGEREGGRGKIGEEDLEVQTVMYKVNKIQRYIVWCREYSQHFSSIHSC